MKDLIYRQAAIDAVNEYLRLSEVSKTVQNMTSIQAILRWLPSAQPQWILCSDELPEEDLSTGMGRQYSNSVLMTVFDKSDDEIMVDVGHTRDGEWYSDTADEFIESIADWKVIAWMPLPEPYKGGDQDG